MDLTKRVLYVCDKGSHLITHDGYMQLGIHHQSIEKHRELRHPDIDWHEVHWVPDIFGLRYMRVAFQKTQACHEGAGLPSTETPVIPT